MIIENPSKLPYHNTKIPASKTKADIIELLKKFGIEDVNLMKYHGKEMISFIWTMETTEVKDGKNELVKKEIHLGFSPPEILISRRIWDSDVGRNVRKNVPNDAVSWRILLHLLKNHLWGIKFGVEKVEEVFMSHITIPLPDGTVRYLADYLKQITNHVEQIALPKPEMELTEEENKIVDADIVQSLVEEDKNKEEQNSNETK